MTSHIARESDQDFATRMAVYSRPGALCKWLPRVLANDSQATFERYLHEAMGYRAEHSDPLTF